MTTASSEWLSHRIPILAAKAQPIPKVSFIDNEPEFRWALLEDQMAFDKLHEGIKKFAQDGETLKDQLRKKLTAWPRLKSHLDRNIYKFWVTCTMSLSMCMNFYLDTSLRNLKNEGVTVWTGCNATSVIKIDIFWIDIFSVLSKRLPNEVESLCCHLLANHSLDACKPFIHATRGPHVHMFTTTSHFLRQRKQSLTSVSRGITESTCLDRWELNSLPHLILILCSIPCWWFRAWWRWSREPGTEGKMKSCISWWCAPSMNPSCVFELRGVANQERSLVIIGEDR